MSYDNAIIHLYPSSPFIVKACINLREGRKIRMQVPIRDLDAACCYLFDHVDPCIPVRVITHP